MAVKKPQRDTAGAALKREVLPVRLWSLDTSYFKDKVLAFMYRERGAPGCWLLHRNPAEGYLRQITSEHKHLVTDKKGVPSEEWIKSKGGGENHWWDCEVYAAAAADMIQVFALRDESVPSSEFLKSLRKPAPPNESQAPTTRRIPRKKGGRIRRRDR